MAAGAAARFLLRARSACNEACIALLSTTPTSLAGAAAVLEYVNKHEWGDESSYSILANTSFESSDERLEQASRDFLPMIANTIRRLASTAS